MIRIDGNRGKDEVYADLQQLLARSLETPKLPSPEEYVLAAPRNKRALNIVLGTMSMGCVSRELLLPFVCARACDVARRVFVTSTRFLEV